MERQKEVVLFKPTDGPDPDACPKCRAHMEPFDGADIKGRNHRGKLCPKCRYFMGVRFDKSKPSRGRVDPKRYGQHEEKFEGRIRPKGRSDW
jgi:hypothetical protein